MRNRFILSLLCLNAISAIAHAEETHERPNVLVIIVEGFDGVGVPAEGLEEVLFDPEIRARVTPNLERLAALGARFDRAYGRARDLDRLARRARVTGGYRDRFATPSQADAPPHDRTSDAWPSTTGKSSRRWIKLVPQEPTVENWERLANAQSAIAVANGAAAAIGDPSDDDAPRLLIAQLANDDMPRLAGVFFDRFPIDQIRVPAELDARRALAERMGAYDFDPTDLSNDEQVKWRQAIQAWLAGASALDYAVGTIVDAIEAADEPWTVVLAATPASGVAPEHFVRETGGRAGLVVVAPRVTRPGHRVATPVDLSGLARSVVDLASVDPDAINATDKPVNDANFLAPLPGRSFLPLLTPGAERYDLVAINSAGGRHGVRSHRFRLVHFDGEPQEFYDLEKDPEGFHNLLDPENRAKIDLYELTDTQVEAVRTWLVERLEGRLRGGNSDNELTPPTTPGDYNRDGVVDAADNTIWRDQHGHEVPVGSGADGDHDGRVDDEDQALWRANYGRRAPPG